MTLALVESTANPLWQEMAIARDKSTRSRLRLFLDFQQQTGQEWHSPDLAAWRDELLNTARSPATVSAYLFSVRGAYSRILRDNSVRDLLYSYTNVSHPPERRKALVDEMLTRIQNAIHPSNAAVEQKIVQDRADSEFIRLSPSQAVRLIEAPDTSTLDGLRDAALIAVLLCTGIREQELCDLKVEDLSQTYEGLPSLRVCDGKGDKQRMVPYGELDWCLIYVNKWLERAGIEQGYVFRGCYKGNKRVRDEKLLPRSVQRILKQYPLPIAGKLAALKPHDCRRSYARMLFDAGMELLAISKNLGHASINTTTTYIGDLSAEKRQPMAVFQPDLSRLTGEK